MGSQAKALTGERISALTGKQMRRDIRPIKLTYKGESITVDMPGWYSDDSRDGQHNREDMRVSDEALRVLKARVAARLTAPEVRRIRKKLGLTQKAATELFVGSGAVNTFQKYESGETNVSHAVGNLLWLLDRRPELLADLKQRFREKASAKAA